MTDRPPLKPPTRGGSLSDQVAAQIQSLVRRSALRPGDRLPSERELCELLGVSRTVVREAVRSLVAKGLLEVRRGDGTVVRAPDPAMVSEMLTLMLNTGAQEVPFASVQEVRRLLEVEFAGVAAERRSEGDLDVMRAQLLAMGEREEDPQAWAEADVAFHAAIATATQNPLYPLMLSSIANMLIEVRLTGISLPDTPRRALSHHSAIFEQISAGNAAGARRAMQAHLRESEETFRRARFARVER